MTYRDSQTYHNVVLRAPLYPINSLMLHGLICGKTAGGLTRESDPDFRDQVRAYFGSGTQLQELYTTPELLSPADWDSLAASAKWSKANADILKDVHWVGGDPSKLEPYGWAAWKPDRGVLTLRNPSA